MFGSIMAEQVGGMPSPGAGEYLEQAMAWSDEVRARWRVALDLLYGDDARQRLDVYRPPAGAAGGSLAPVLLFFYHHGAGRIPPGLGETVDHCVVGHGLDSACRVSYRLGRIIMPWYPCG